MPSIKVSQRRGCPAGGGTDGFALILAMLSLLLLTFLGLTLSLTTSTELQIAKNYHWSQQALYNAEAGIEVGKSLLRTMNWSLILPAARTGSDVGGCRDFDNTRCWFPAIPLPVAGPGAPYTRADAAGNPTRNFENATCDARGSGTGFGVVLDDGGGEAPYQNVSSIFGRQVNGSFTLWVRRTLVPNQDGSYSDFNDSDDALVLTSEGVAPYQRAAAGGDLAALNRAVRVLEVTVSRTLEAPCGTRGGQVGGGPEGSNFSPCDPITAAAVGKAIGRVGVTENTNVQ